jgi:hypothetical protein
MLRALTAQQKKTVPAGAPAAGPHPQVTRNSGYLLYKTVIVIFTSFGNILADELVVGVLVSLVPLIIPIPIMLLGCFTSAIQALVFATLAGAYIGEAVEDHH